MGQFWDDFEFKRIKDVRSMNMRKEGKCRTNDCVKACKSSTGGLYTVKTLDTKIKGTDKSETSDSVRFHSVP